MAATRQQSPLAVRGEREAGPNVCARQVREILEDILLSHAGRQVLQHVGYRDAQAADAGLAAAFSGLNRDSIQLLHQTQVRQCSIGGQVPASAYARPPS